MGRPKGFNREEVLAKTAKLFWRKGFAETSLQDIEKATGVNKSGLYSEFLNKDDVFVASLGHYIDTTGIVERLDRKPLGWGNIKDLLLSPQTCDGQKGCFIVSSVRESQILPPKAKALIAEHLVRLKSSIKNNLESEGLGKDAELIANLLLTFNSGLCLEANLKLSAEMQQHKIEAFIRILKQTFK